MADNGQAVVKAPLTVGGKVAPIIPQTFDEAWRCAQLLCASGMTPRDINTEAKVMATIMAGAEIGMAPFQALQSFAIINGRPALWGDGMLGVVRARGVRVTETMSGEGEEAVASCTVTRPDTGEAVTRTFSVEDAKAAKLWGKRGSSGQDTPWITYPKRMLQMRARAWAIRDCCADILRGIQMAEEAQDIEVIGNEPVTASADSDVFIKGAEKDALVEDWNARMRASTEIEEIDYIMAEAAEKKTRLSSNTWDGLEHVAAQESERISAGVAPKAPEPSPFEELKAMGLACAQVERFADAQAAYSKFLAKANSRTLLARCTLPEREEIKTLKKTIKAEIDAKQHSGANTPASAEGAPDPDTALASKRGAPGAPSDIQTEQVQ